MHIVSARWFKKNITVPDFILYMGAIASFSTWMNGIVSNMLTLKRENPRMNDVRTFIEYKNKFDPENPCRFRLSSIRLRSSSEMSVFDIPKAAPTFSMGYLSDPPQRKDCSGGGKWCG